MQCLVTYHYDWLCMTARKAERLLAATRAQDLANVDRKHGGGQVNVAKVQANREQARVKSESLDGGHYDFDCDDEDSPESAVRGSKGAEPSSCSRKASVM